MRIVVKKEDIKADSAFPPLSVLFEMSSVETESVQQPSSTYQWLAQNPLTAAAGNTIASLYEGSKNSCRLAGFVIGTAETSVKYAAGTAAPLVKKLETPINAVDEFTFHQLQKLEGKVPAITKPPGALLSEGKEAITSSVTVGKDAICTRLQAGSEALSNTRAGHLVGSGVCHTLAVTEMLVDYLLPADENDKELVPESEKEVPKSEKEEPKREELKSEEPAPPSTATRVTSISRKLKVRVYYRTLRKLHATQQQCKSALDQLKEHVDVLNYAVKARDKVVAEYHAAQYVVKEAEAQVSKLWRRENKVAPTSEEEDEDIEWLTPKKKARMEAALDYTKHLGEVVYGKLQYVSKAAAYLPHQLKDSTVQALNYAQELYTTVKTAKSASELSSTAVNRLSEILKTQIGYCQQLGNYLSDTLSAKTKSHRSPSPASSVEGSESEEVPKDDKDEKSESEEELMDVGGGDLGAEDESAHESH